MRYVRVRYPQLNAYIHELPRKTLDENLELERNGVSFQILNSKPRECGNTHGPLVTTNLSGGLAMADTIFPYRGHPCQIVRHPSDSLIQIINPHRGRKKTVPAREVAAIPYAKYRRRANGAAS